jgi:hypothetical protein
MRTTLLFAVPIFVLPQTASADATCFPACRTGYLCNAQGQCVSACNPPCDAQQACERGECIDKPAAKPDAAREAAPPRPFELTLGVGAQKGTAGGAQWSVTPEVAFDYTFNAGQPFEVFVGGRARYDFDASIGAAGGEVGVRGVVQSADAFVRGGLFASLRPEIAFGNLTHPSLEAGIAGGGARPVPRRGPHRRPRAFAVQGIYSFSTEGTTHSRADLMISGEAGIRF